MSNSYSVSSIGLVCKFPSKPGFWFWDYFAQILMLLVFRFKLLMANVACSSLLLTGYSWLHSSY